MFRTSRSRSLAGVLEEARPTLLARVPAAHDLLRDLIRALRAGGSQPLTKRKTTPAYLRTLHLLKESVAKVIEQRAPNAPAREVLLVADWFAAAAERTLRDENRRLVGMLDALPDHVFLKDRSGRILFLNRSTAELTSAVVGRPREELLGVSVMDGPQPASFKRYAMEIVERAGNGETLTEEFVLPGPDGPQWRETHLAPVYGDDGEVEAVAVASRDIHARKQAEGRLQLLSKIGALVGTDSDAVLAGVAGATIPELGDLAILEVLEDGGGHFKIAHGDPELAAAVEACLRAGLRVPEVMEQLGATTTLTVPIVVLGAPIARATFAYTRESDRHHGPDDRAVAEEVARRAAQIVENARLHEELAQSVMFRERVMGILGHDLRNPLAAVLSLSALLGQWPDVPERAKEGLVRIRHSAERMQQMVHTILDLTQLRFHGAPQLARKAFDFGALTHAIVDELQVAHPNRSIAVAARGDLAGHWDYTRIGQVISNLVGNALTHGAHESPIRVALSSDCGWVVMAVSNRGPTIPASKLAKLFDPFWQADAQSKPRGLGLGLFIAQQIVLAHEGSIDVRSEDEQTTFTVRLPCGDA